MLLTEVVVRASGLVAELSRVLAPWRKPLAGTSRPRSSPISRSRLGWVGLPGRYRGAARRARACSARFPSDPIVSRTIDALDR